MRAAVYHQPGRPWSIETVPDPVPGVGEAVLRVGRCGICGSDVSMTSGKVEGFCLPTGVPLGHEFCGEVVALGEGVTNLRLGQMVSAMPLAGCGHCRECRAGQHMLCRERASYRGGMAEYVRVGAKASVVLPAALSLADGALVEPLAVAFHAVRFAQMPKGARVLVTGVGAVGLGAIYWARQLGAGPLAALSRTARRADLALAMGADRFVTGGPDELGEVIEALGGEPDFIFECVGVPGALMQAIRHVGPDGTVVSLGFCGEPEPFDSLTSTLKQVRLLFSFGYTLGEFREVVDRIDAGAVEPRAMVSTVIGLAEVPAMIESLRSGSVATKVHVDPWLA